MKKHRILLFLLCVASLAAACGNLTDTAVAVSEDEREHRPSCEVIKLEEELKAVIYNENGEEIYSESAPLELENHFHVKEITDGIFEIGISTGSSSYHAHFFNSQTFQTSDGFFNPILWGDHYIAYMKEGKENKVLILSDIFDKTVFYKEIERDFMVTAVPMSSIIGIGYDHDKVILSYMRESDQKVYTEEISLDD